MRVAVKNMSGVFIHSTTPRKTRLLLKEKKAVIESNNPFTIRLLFSESECELKDSKPLNKLNSCLLSEKDIIMCNKELLYEECNNTESETKSKNIIIYEKDNNNMYEIKNQPSIISTVSNRGTFEDHIQYFDSRDVDEFVKYYGCIPTKLCTVGIPYNPNKHTVITEIHNYPSELLFLKYVSMAEDKIDKNDIRLDKQIYDIYLLQILKKDDRCHIYKYIVYSRMLDMFIICKSYIVVQPEGSNCIKCNKNDISRFVIRNLLFDFVGDEGSKKWNALTCIINLFDFAPKPILWKLDTQISEMKKVNPSFEYDFDKFNDAEYVLEYSAYSLYNKKKNKEFDCSVSETKDVIDGKPVSDEQNNNCNQIFPNQNIPKTHLIFGYYGCGKTTYIRQLINEKIQNCLGVCVLTNAYSAKMYFNKEDKNLHIFTIADILTFLPDKEKNPINIAKAIVDCFVANVCRFNIDTIAVDGMDMVIPSINSDYSEDEYFRELSKCCKGNKFNLLYTKGINKIENDSSYHKIPNIFERFSDIVTVIK